MWLDVTSPVTGTNSTATLYLAAVISFWLNILKRSAKAPAVDVSGLNTQRYAKATFVTPELFDEHPCIFIWESFRAFFKPSSAKRHGEMTNLDQHVFSEEHAVNDCIDMLS